MPKVVNIRYRGCIGYRFALAESKILLMKLVESFEFLPRDVGGTPVASLLFAKCELC